MEKVSVSLKSEKLELKNLFNFWYILQAYLYSTLSISLIEVYFFNYYISELQYQKPAQQMVSRW